jgi:hypothetical protein
MLIQFRELVLTRQTIGVFHRQPRGESNRRFSTTQKDMKKYYPKFDVAVVVELIVWQGIQSSCAIPSSAQET